MPCHLFASYSSSVLYEFRTSREYLSSFKSDAKQKHPSSLPHDRRALNSMYTLLTSRLEGMQAVPVWGLRCVGIMPCFSQLLTPGL